MEQELIWKASFLEKQVQEIEQNINFVENEIIELEKLSENLNFLSKSKENLMLSLLGKGIHVKTSLSDKNLFVEVGSGVVVRKAPEEAMKIIESQIKKLTEARIHLLGKLDIYNKSLQELMVEIEYSNAHNANHQHNENHSH